MSKRNPFAEPEDNQPADAETFGTVTGGLRASNPSVRIQQISINETYADPKQNRRIAPSHIRGVDWAGTPKQITAILERWHEAVQDELKQKINLHTVVANKQPLPELPSDASVLTTRFIELVKLAASIHATGLQQAIQVCRDGDIYRVIMGERRLTAYNLLYWLFGFEKFARIPANVVNVDAWELVQRQVLENNMRQDVNAIGKSRQLSTLLQAAIEKEEGRRVFKRLDECGHEWDHYSQVADGTAHPIPYGMGPEIYNLLDMTAGTFRKYRSLLNLTNDAVLNRHLWVLADDRDWSEKFMREMVQFITFHDIDTWVNKINADESIMREWIKDSQEQAQNEKKRSLGNASQDEIEDDEPENASTPPLQRGEDDFGTSYVNPNQPKYDGKQYSEEETARIEALREQRARMGTPDHTQRQPKFKVGDWVVHDGRGLGQVALVKSPTYYHVVMNSDKRRLEMHVDELTAATNLHSLPPHDIVGYQMPPQPSPQAGRELSSQHEKFRIRQRVETPDGYGYIVALVEDGAHVRLDGSSPNDDEYYEFADLSIQTELPFEEAVEGNNDDSIAPVDLPLLIGAVDCMADMAFQLDVEGYDERMRELSRMLDKINRGDLNVSLSGLGERFAEAVDLLEFAADQLHANWSVITQRLGRDDDES